MAQPPSAVRVRERIIDYRFPAEAIAVTTASQTDLSPTETVAAALENYAQRGVFRGFSRGPVKKGRATFKMMWHRDRLFELVFDSAKATLRFTLVLPNVPPDSAMYREFKKFVRSRQSEELPEHRRIDKKKAEVRPYNRAGNVSLTLKLKDGDYEYGTGKIVNLVHEIFMVFLHDGYFEYMVENFDLDPDTM